MEGKKIAKFETTKHAGQRLRDANPPKLEAGFSPNLGNSAQILVVLPRFV